jgi:NADH-quinone oxidoreductase chain G
MITITINDKKIELEKPVTVLEAARANGIKIPTFCHHPVLELWGGCRMCLVEVQKIPRLQTACTMMAADGMVVYTETQKVIEARKAVLEFLLINHPLDCPVCDKAGECDLQDMTVKYGAAAGRFAEGKRKRPESKEDPILVRNMERCILCTRCVRMCSGVQGVSAIDVMGRGNHSFVEPFTDGRQNCEYCGNCVAVCPVGAIMSRLHRYSYRSWQMDRSVKTVCSFCGVGCQVVLQVRDNGIKKVVSQFGKGVNNGLLCNRGRFGYEYTSHPERLTTPLIRENGQLREASWSEALDYTANKLLAIKSAGGGESIGAIASARCTNEENYLLQKIMRAGLESNNIDSIARLGLLPAQEILEELLGQGITANIMAGIVNSDAVLVTATDPSRVNPVLGLQVRAAGKAGKNVLTIGHAPGLKKHRTQALPARPGTEGLVLAGLLKELLKVKTLSGENKSLEEAIAEWELPGEADIEKVAGISYESIKVVASTLKDSLSASMIIGRDLMAQESGRANMHIVAALAYLLNGRIFLASERPNEQGLTEVGCAPDMLPGERPLEMENFRKKFEDAWGVKLSANKGLTLMEMLEAANSGKLKALYVMGENPAFNLPDAKKVKEALSNLDLLVVQDIFMTETAEMAHVVLPALGWAEKEGTFVNLEKRMQLLRKALFREGMEDWKILSELGARLGAGTNYEGVQEIMKELAAVSPIHAGLSYEDLAEGMLWPYKGEPLRHGPTKPGKISASDFKVKSNGKLSIALNRTLFHSGTLSRHSEALLAIQGEPIGLFNAKTGAELGLEDSCLARVSTDRGSVLIKVQMDEEAPEGVIFLGNNFKKAGAMSLFSYELESGTKTPVLSAKNIKVERVRI